MVTVNQCCCGCSLRTGTIIIGIFNLIATGAALITFATYSSATANFSDESVVAVFIVFAVIYGIQFVANILLLVAVFADKHMLFLPWLIIHIIVLTLTTIAYLAVAVIFFMVPQGIGVGFGVGFIVALVIGGGLQFYFILVVFSLYKEVKGQS